MISYVENPKGSIKKALRSNEFPKVEDIRSRHKTHLYFQILEMKKTDKKFLNNINSSSLKT